MPSVDASPGLLPSILDRLIDRDSSGTAWKRGYTEKQMVEAVHRDLEDLLNTRQTVSNLPEGLAECQRSVLAFGLPDFTTLSDLTPEHCDRLGRMLEDTIKQFEPRLQEVRATRVGEEDSKTRSVRFRVVARLCLDPAPEVAFDTTLELITGHSTVRPTEK